MKNSLYTNFYVNVPSVRVFVEMEFHAYWSWRRCKKEGEEVRDAGKNLIQMNVR